MQNIQVSAVVITYNEEENIEKCLSSISWADEIVVVDAYSADATVELAKEYTDKIYFHKFSDFAAQRNYALRFTVGKWILVLDADETLLDNAEKNIKQLIKSKKILGFWLPRRNYVSRNKYLKHGYFYPDYQLKCFRNYKNVKYVGSIHAQPDIDIGKTKKIDNPETYHNPSHSKYNSFLSFRRFFPYIRIEGKEMAEMRKSNYKLLAEGFSESISFIYRSFIKTEGYKDGFAGLKAAVNYGMYILGIRLYALFIRSKKGKYF